jgi:hypothetical protein
VETSGWSRSHVDQPFGRGALQRHGFSHKQIFKPLDTIFMFEDSLDSARNLKFILCIFEQLTGLEINFHKSEVSFLGAALDKQEMYTHIFTCKKGDFPFRYLGIPMHFKRLLNSDWKDVEDRIEKKNTCWKGNISSIGSRLILLEASLSSITSYMMSFFTMPKGVLKRCDFFRARMLWQEKVNVKKYHLVKWSDVCQPKDQGGLGVTDLHLKNVSLLCKWIWRLENEEGLWQDLIKAKYLKNVLFLCSGV